MTAPRALDLSDESVFEAAHPATLAVTMLMIEDAARMGQLDLAWSLAQAARRSWGQEPALLLIECRLLARRGCVTEAFERLALVKAMNPDDVVAEMYEAMVYIETKDHGSAKRCLRSVVRRCPDYPGVAGTLASLVMPGPNYREVLGWLHHHLRPRGYLEVGVETGATLSLARAERIVGVDPDLGPLRREHLAAHAVLYEMTSQQFFAEQRRDEIFGTVPLDLVFIDGLHQYEAALHDFLSVERWAHSGTVVVMHDALPIAPIYAEPDRRTRFWVGDVWKAVYVLFKRRPDLRIRIVPTVPSGLVVMRFDDSKRALTMDDAGEVLKVEFPELGEQEPVWPRELPLVSNDSAGYKDALGESVSPQCPKAIPSSGP